MSAFQSPAKVECLHRQENCTVLAAPNLLGVLFPMLAVLLGARVDQLEERLQSVGMAPPGIRIVQCKDCGLVLRLEGVLESPKPSNLPRIVKPM